MRQNLNPNTQEQQARQAIAAIAEMPVQESGPWVFEALPENIRIEAEKTVSEDWLLNFSLDDLVWERKKCRIAPIAEELIEQLEGDEEFMEHAFAMGRLLKTEPQREPIVFGPCGLEGHHRLVGAHLEGIKTLNAVVARHAPIVAARLRGQTRRPSP
jgi:hypothetical protein